MNTVNVRITSNIKEYMKVKDYRRQIKSWQSMERWMETETNGLVRNGCARALEAPEEAPEQGYTGFTLLPDCTART